MTINGLVIIRDADEDGFIVSESSVVSAIPRLKIAAVIYDGVRLRGHRQHVLGILAEHSASYEKLDSLFDKAIAAVPTPTPSQRAARREALVIAASHSGFANPVAVGAEFDSWAAENDKPAKSSYGRSPISWIESVLIAGNRLVTTQDQSSRISSILRPEVFQNGTTFSAPLLDIDALTWPDIFDLRRNPRLQSFRKFVVERLPGDIEPERVKDEMLDAYQKLAEDVRPRGDGHLVMRIIGQLPGLPVNPVSLARDISGAVHEYHLNERHGHLFFIDDVRKIVSTAGKASETADSLGPWAKTVAEYIFG